MYNQFFEIMEIEFHVLNQKNLNFSENELGSKYEIRKSTSWTHLVRRLRM